MCSIQVIRSDPFMKRINFFGFSKAVLETYNILSGYLFKWFMMISTRKSAQRYD